MLTELPLLLAGPPFCPPLPTELKEKFVRLPLHSSLVEQLAAAIQTPGFVARQQVGAGGGAAALPARPGGPAAAPCAAPACCFSCMAPTPFCV